MDLKVLSRPSDWCTPAQIYAVLTLLAIVVILFGSEKFAGRRISSLPTKDKVLLSIWEAAWAFLILCAMLYACSKGYEWVSWAILVVPLIFALGRLSKCPKDLKQ